MREPSSSSTSPVSLAPRRLLTLALVLVLVAQLLAPIAGFSSVALADDATPTAAVTTDATTASTDTPTPEPTLAPTDTPAQDPTATDTPTQAPTATDTPAPQPTATDAPVQPTVTDAPAAQPTNPPTKTITGTPTITSDKGDYAPGSLVTLTGKNWQPGETVHIYVNDDAGQTWNRNVDVTADANGAITDSFSLPNWFVATYTVKATTANGAAASTTFTDGNLNLMLATADTDAPSNLSWTATWTKWSGGATCSSGVASTGSATYVGNSLSTGGQPGIGSGDSAEPTGATAAGYTLTYWSISPSATTPLTGSALCVAGPNGTSNPVTLYAHFKSVKQNQTISFVQPTSPASYGATFNVNPTSDSGLAVSVAASGGCTVAPATAPVTGYTVTMTSSTADCTLTASQTGNANYNAATDVIRTVSAQKANQTITFAPLADKTYGDANFGVSASASSGLAVSFAVGSTDTCTISGSTVHITGAGSCTVTASQAGNGNYNAAPSVPRTFTINKANQATLTVTAPTSGVYNDKLVPSATGGSGTGAVTFTASGTACQMGTGPDAGKLVITSGTGTCSITAHQAGDANYNPIDSAASPVAIGTASQTITFAGIADKTYGDADFDPGATASSGLPVSYGASGNCSIISGEVHITGAGTCTVTASQAGDSNYNAAPSVPQIFTINKANQAALTIDSPNAGSYNQRLTMTASGGTTGGTITFAVVSGSTGCAILTAGVDIGKLAITNGIGSCSIMATMAGNTNYNDVTSAAHVVAISKASQTITFDQPATPAVYNTTFNVSPSSNSDLDVSVAASGACSISGGTVTMTSGTGVCTLTASQAGDDNYLAASNVVRTVAAAKKDQTITFDPLGDKTYGDADFTVGATASSGLAVTFAAGLTDNCTISGSTVHITGAGSCTVTASQAGNDNYNAAPSVDQPFSIGQKELTISGATANDKTYDGGSVATVDFSQASLVGIVGTDQVSIDSANYSASFNDKNVGVNKAVTVTGVALSGANAGNYTVAQPSGLRANIAVKGLTVTGITASDKTYDGGTAAALNTDSAKLVGAVSGDDVSLVTTSASGVFGDKTVETGKTVTVSGLTLSGTDKDNYSLTQPTTTASIFAKELTISGLAASDKTYDGSDVAAITGTPELVGAVDGDSVSLTGTAAGTFDSKDAGSNKTVTVSGLSLAGADKDNYTLTLPTLTATISKAGLTISGAAAQDKVYDRTLAATVDFSHASLSGVVSSENVTIDSSACQAAFATASVGNGKAVTVTGVALGGADAGNYTVSQPSGLTANITPKSITGSFTASNKVYDGTTSAAASNLTLDGVITGDTVNLSGGTASFADKNVGTGKTVTLTGASLGGADAGNYSLTSVSTTTANITAATVTGSFTASDKIYDGTTAATIETRSITSGIVGSEDVTLTGGSASFADANVGPNKTVTGTGFALGGADAANYALGTVATTTASITAKSITGSFAASSKTYDGGTAAMVTGRSLSGVIGTDDVTLTGGTAAFVDKNVGTGKIVTLTGATLGGADKNNYSLTSVGTTTANITPLGITGSFTTQSKVYDGTTAATVLTRSLSGAILGDDVSLTGGTATFSNTIGQGLIVTLTGATLSGTDAGNYTLTSVATTTASITYAPSKTLCLGAAGHAILQPINADGSSVFKQGSTVPAKFRVCDANGNSVGAPGVVASFRLVQTTSGTVASPVNESVVSTTPDTAFRWSATDQLWIFNINTKSLRANTTYTYQIILNDGSTIMFTFGLK